MLKEEKFSTVEWLRDPGPPATSVVRKEYRMEPGRGLRSLGQPSRAFREFCNLWELRKRGVDAIEPLGVDEDRHRLCVTRSVLTTRFAPETINLRDVLQDPATPPRKRRDLLAASALLTRTVHQAGCISTTLYPRNVLSRASETPSLLVCDQPHAHAFGGFVTKRLARAAKSDRPRLALNLLLVDLYDAGFSPSQKRRTSRIERFRFLHAYVEGDPDRLRRLWPRTEHRRRSAHRFTKGLVRGWHFLTQPRRLPDHAGDAVGHGRP